MVIQFSDLNPGSTGIGGSEGGTGQRFDNVLTPPASFTTSTGLPGSTPPSEPAADPGETVTVTNFYASLGGSDAPKTTGSTSTSPWPEHMTNPWVPVNPAASGVGQGSVTNGSQRIGHGA